MAGRDFASAVADKAMRAGASAAEVVVREGTEFSASVRLGEVETVSESASKGLGLRVIVEGRQASVSTSDFGEEAVARLVAEAVDLARVTSPDETADLPEPGAFAGDAPDLALFDPAVAALTSEQQIEMAVRAEREALGTDPRVTNFDRGGVSSSVSRSVLANSRGFAGEYVASSISLSVVPVVESGGEMQRDYWYDSRRSVAELESPELIGRRAAERALRKLGARKIPTCDVPVVFDPRVARALLGVLLEAVSGDSIFRKASFLVGRLGERVAAEGLTVVDDGRLRGGLGSRPFDGEGVATRRTVVLERGVLESYLLNTYTARKLGAASTGNAVRGLVGQVGVGAGNLFVEAGATDPAEMLRAMKRGFLVTELIGFGANVVNGDYSQGASGLWVEGGEVAFPVHEVTIAGNLKDMLRGVLAVGSDLEFRGRVGAPSLMIDRMVVSGQ